MQMFFKEFIIMLLDDGVFCKHLIDSLVHRIDVLNSMEWASELQEGMHCLIYLKYKLFKRKKIILSRCNFSTNLLFLC